MIECLIYFLFIFQCDGYGSIQKFKVKREILRTEGKATNAKEFAQMQVGNNPTANVLVFCGDINNNSKPEIKSLNIKSQIDKVSKYYGFTFSDEGIKVEKSSGLGPGRFYTNLDPIEFPAKYNGVLVTENGPVVIDENTDLKLLTPKNEILKPIRPLNKKETITLREDNKLSKYSCSRMPCTASFDTPEELIKHNAEECFVDIKLSKTESWMTTFSRQYFKRFSMGSGTERVNVKVHLESLQNPRVLNSLLTSNEPTIPCKMGDALPVKRPPIKKSDDLKQFLKEKFDQGQKTGNKLEASKVEEEMKTAKNNEGKKRFPVSQHLDAGQIKTYWSQLYAKIKFKTSDEVSEDQIEEATQKIESVNNARHEEMLFQQLKNIEPEEDVQFVHGALSNGVDFCGIAYDFQVKNGRGQLFIETEYSKDQVRDAMKPKGIKNPRGGGYKAMAKAITEYVTIQCPDKCVSIFTK